MTPHPPELAHCCITVGNTGRMLRYIHEGDKLSGLYAAPGMMTGESLGSS